MADKEIKIEKLTENNFHIWKFKIKSLLEDKDLDAFLTSNPEDNDEWRKKDKKTRAIIRLTVENEIIPFISQAATTKNTWDILEQRFNQNSGLNKFYLRRKLYSMKKADGESINAYISKIRNIEQILRGIGENLQDAELVSVLLNGLPKEFETVIANLETVENLTSQKSRIKIDTRRTKKSGRRRKRGDISIQCHSTQKEKLS
jgi:hypothetical protein